MREKIYECLEIKDLKEMLKKSGELYGDNVAFRIKLYEGKYRTITHKQVREMINNLGTALIDMGLKGKRIAIIGENRYEWELAYLSIVCGTGVVVPLDKMLPENELEALIERSQVEAIFYSEKYEQMIENIKNNSNNKLKYLISMDLDKEKEGKYSQNKLLEKGKNLIKKGDTRFIDAKIDENEMNIMLFTSGTTSASKVVGLSHKNICSNLMDIAITLDVNSNDRFLSFLPLHHVFECTVGFLFSLYIGAETNFCDGVRHIVENLNEYKTTVFACVPAVYENIYKNIKQNLKKAGRWEVIQENIEKYKNATIDEKKEVFIGIHNILGGELKLLLSGAASLDPAIEKGYRELGFNLVQGYGLTETSPVVSAGSNKYNRIGSVGRPVPSVEVKIENPNEEGIGEIIVKGPSVMIGYYENEKSNKESLKEGWFYTGDLGCIDKDGFIFISGRKKNVIVLKNGKNIYPEEIESLVNRIEGVEESFVFGKSKDNDDIKIFVKIVYNKEKIKELYKTEDEKEIFEMFNKKIKEVNRTVPSYKTIKGMILTETPLIKTTTNKVKRQEELDLIKCS